MRLVMLGPPGAGKGTQARMLSERLGVAHIASGDLLRNAGRSGSALGLKAKVLMDRGQLVPDEMVLKLIEARMRQHDAQKGFILDGFPRSPAQAEALEAMLHAVGGAIDRVVALSVPDEEIVQRNSGRRTCRNCGASFQTVFDPPQVAGKCDKCGGNLFQRADDKEDTVRARLKVYQESTRPVVEYYARQGSLARVDGMGKPAEILKRILKALGTTKLAANTGAAIR
ncbi:MAG: adenylate kinase [Candidatus Binataceae bacterium]